MTGIILHQYDSSPFSEKVRVCFGIKGLEWQACDQPVIMPKPNLTPLTGGYRRIPVMQIGADIYCDSALIVREIDRRFPEPTLFPNGSRGMANAVEIWADRALFQSAVMAIFGTLGENVDPAFIKDREALSGQPFNVQAMKALVPFAVTQIKAQAAMLAEQLASGQAFLEGADPGLADAAAYYNFWFIHTFCPGLCDRFPDLPELDAWYDRVKAIGHGTRLEASPADALSVAKSSEPIATETLPADAAIAGKQVAVAAADYGRDPIVGTFAGSTQFSVSIRREDSDLGTITVHLPRLGYSITPL